MLDAIVIGAGPAGMAAALRLHSAGCTVVVIDKARFPRDKCCGDGLTTGALRELATIGFDPAGVPSWQRVDAAWVRSPRGHEIEFPFPQHVGLFGAVAPRREFDAALVRLGRSRGLEVREGVASAGVTQDEDAMTVTTAEGTEIRCRYVVAADGMWSPTRKQLGLSTPGYLGEWHAFRQYADHVTGSAAERLWVWFDADLLPGYAWSFPLPGGRANLGFGVARNGRTSGHDLKAIWTGLADRPHIRAALGPEAVLSDRHLAWPIPARIDKVTLGQGRALVVGDAAAATDPMTGEGIGQALLTGRLAAEAILAHPTTPAAMLAGYTRSVSRHLVADHRLSVMLSRVLAHERGASASLRIAGSTPWTRRNFARWLFEDEPRAALFTPRRWHRGFLHRSGAYLPGSLYGSDPVTE